MSFAQLMRCLGFRKTRPEQDPSCHILNLPSEIILLILEYLPQYQQIILYQTCYPLHRLVLDYSKVHKESDGLHLSAKLDQHQRIEYLFTLARSRPNVWACHTCTKLHLIRRFGTPTDKYYTFPCQGGDDYYMQETHMIHYGHTQFALKYSRLQIEDRNSIAGLKKSDKWYFENLMRPFSAPIRPDMLGLGMSDKVKGTIRIFPRVTDGRFLIHSVRTFTKDAENVSRKSIYQFQICPHQVWAPDHWQYEGPWSPKIQYYRDRSWARMYTNPRNAFELASVFAFFNGNETSGSCIFCETDFSVQASSEVAVVRVWQNLGSEALHFNNISWYWQTGYDHHDAVYFEPGRVRELYDQDKTRSEGTCSNA